MVVERVRRLGEVGTHYLVTHTGGTRGHSLMKHETEVPSRDSAAGNAVAILHVHLCGKACRTALLLTSKLLTS